MSELIVINPSLIAMGGVIIAAIGAHWLGLKNDSPYQGFGFMMMLVGSILFAMGAVAWFTLTYDTSNIVLGV